MLHPCIRGNDEKTREPRTEEHGNRGPPVGARAELLLSIEKETQERRFQEEREHAFHGQRLANHAASKAREMGPVSAELEFHGNAGYHAEHEVDAEDARPEACRLVISLIVAPETQALEHHDEWRQSHGELGK